MNQKQWNTLLKAKKECRHKNFFYYRNLAQKILGYKRNKGLTIHHLRDTEEQRKFNDEYYERWGIDFDGQLKYCVLMTIEEHVKIHHISEETKEKISKSVSKAKKKYTEEELKEHRKAQNKRYADSHKEKKQNYDKNYYERNKEYIKQRVKFYKQNKRKHKNKN